MAEQPTRPTAPSRTRQDEPPPRITSGWRVTPAPDGRGRQGSTPNGPKAPKNTRWLVVLLIVGLLALNLWISSQALKPSSRVRIPYSPTFLTQVKDNNVKEISSTSDSIQGTFYKAVKYPPGEAGVPGGDELLDSGPVIRQRHAALGAAGGPQRHDRREQPGYRPVVAREPDLRVRPDAPARGAVRVHHAPGGDGRRRRGRA